ncbi:MAG: DUF362 domain-containing protein [Bacteroidota bacterium]
MKRKSSFGKILFFVGGIGSLVWFLVRVIPKPSRATYPCMRAAAPIMSSFIIYLLSLSGSVVAFRKARGFFRNAQYKSSLLFGIISIAVAVVFFWNDAKDLFGSDLVEAAVLEDPNTPMGVANGLFPGRVAWVMDKEATNENCSNGAGDYWFMEKNTSQEVVSKMLSDGLKSLSGQENDADAWDALFKYFNYKHEKGWVGYSPGEKIVIKLNLTTIGNDVRNLNESMNSTPQLALAMLDQLIGTLNITQSDITLGDPYRGFPDEIWDKCQSKYPDVHYIEGTGSDGREQTELSTGELYFNSDNAFRSRLPKAYVNADYLINMPCLKSHGSAGITLAAKNHQGSVIAADQNPTNQHMGSYLHYDYPDNPDNQVMGMYRHIVDFMAHQKLGGNTLLYLVDAIWSGRDWFGAVEMWEMAPFNGDWTSSLFLSQDAVAIESVGFDFLYYEYKNHASSHDYVDFPIRTGVSDYIHQAADPANWPAGIKYDPNHSDHSSPVGSLGVHEHWNNAANKQYSRNLGQNKGIELVSHPASLVANLKVDVSGINLPANASITEPASIPLTIIPENATNKDIFWESSDEAVATVSPSGMITPVSAGEVIITAMAADGGKRASSIVTVDLSSDIQIHALQEFTVYPNPVQTVAHIRYHLVGNAGVYAELLSMDGETVYRSATHLQMPGSHIFSIPVDESGIRSGVYLCKLVAIGESTRVSTAKLWVDRK